MDNILQGKSSNEIKCQEWIQTPRGGFKAKPVPNSTFIESNMKVAIKEPFDLRLKTLSLEYNKQKSKELLDMEHNELELKAFKARPVSKGVYKPFTPIISPSRSIVTEQPFGLYSQSRAEERAKYQEVVKNKEDKSEIAKEKHASPTQWTQTPRGSFKASPVPDSTFLEPSGQRSKMKVTTQEPFNLRSEALHSEYNKQKSKEMSDMERKEAELRAFKAQPVPKGVYKPFSPVMSPVMIPEQPFAQYSDSRAEERAKYQEALKDKEEEIAAEIAKEKALQEEREAAAIRELRIQQQFKARHMPDFSEPWSPDTQVARGECEMHNWDAIMDERKHVTETKKDSEARLKEKDLRKSLSFHARKMPDFSQPWDPRHEKRRQSGPQEFNLRKQLVSQSLEGKAWGQMSHRDAVDPVVKA
mmetsp:Transcript_20230/g.28001  ORF Transcript_20230/g.28001 Transcript_20230/m.28001 type:complete len:415 (-) Transcript_20230:142-1386(-)